MIARSLPPQARRRSVAARLCLVAFLLAAAGAFVPAPAAAQTGACQSGTAPAGYSVTVCLTKPAPGATGSGLVQVEATATVTGGGPGVKGIWFFLANAAGNAPRYVMQDLFPPYQWTLPSAYYVDKTYTFFTEVRMNDDFSVRVGVPLTLQNGTASPPVNPNSRAPFVPAGQQVTVAAVGDGAGSEPAVQDVSSMILGQAPDLFLYLGDVYQRGTYAEFWNWYGTPDRNYGRLRAVTNPIVGNHEYGVSGAADYFYWWDNVPRNYSYDAAGWHFVALDSTEQYNQIAPGSAQYDWVAADLAANTLPCTLVYMHHPRFSIGPQKDDPRLADLWALFVNEGVEIALHGHEHQYQRWVALDSLGAAAEGGLTQFIVGTGGYDLQRPSPKTERVAFVVETEGALFLDLTPGRADFRFVNLDGVALDSGTITCRSAALPPPALTETVWLPTVEK